MMVIFNVLAGSVNFRYLNFKLINLIEFIEKKFRRSTTLGCVDLGIRKSE